MAHDPPVENWLSKNGYAWRFENSAPLARIDMKEADGNPARTHRHFDNDLAFAYAEDYAKGDDFPAMVAQEVVGQNLWLLWGGLHRIKACGAAQKTNHDMIVVFGETSAARIDLARRVLNSIGVGKGETIDGKLQHIAQLRKEHGKSLSLEQLASHFRVRRATVTRYLAVIASEERADRIGDKLFWSSPRINQEIKIEAGRLVSDEVFHAVIQLVRDHPTEMRGDSGVDFVKKIRAMGTDKTRLAAIIDRDAELTAIAEERKVGSKRSPTSKTTRFVGYFSSIVRGYPGSADKLHLGDQGSCATLRRLRKQAAQVLDISTEMVSEYDRLIEEAEKVEAWRASRRGSGDSAGISPPA